MRLASRLFLAGAYAGCGRRNLRRLTSARPAPVPVICIAGERIAVTLGPGIFYKSRSKRALAYERYRLDGRSVVCERVTPNARSSVAPHVKFLNLGRLTTSRPPMCHLPPRRRFRSFCGRNTSAERKKRPSWAKPSRSFLGRTSKVMRPDGAACQPLNAQAIFSDAPIVSRSSRQG